jgi:hypothetical protein
MQLLIVELLTAHLPSFVMISAGVIPTITGMMLLPEHDCFCGNIIN